MRRDKKDRKKYHTKEITSTIVFRWIMVFFCSTRFALCHVNLIKDRIAFLKNVPEKKRIRFFILAYAMSQAHTCVHLANARGSIPRSSAAGYLTFRNFSLFFPRGRSPPSNLKLKPKNFRLEEIT